MSQPWFENWFDSKYYHVLYGDRDYAEAESFLQHLIEFLDPDQSSKMLDLACGRGRHSKFLAKMGFDVTGIDLSEKSISYAKKYASEHLHFAVHDMRELYRKEYFDYIFNFFTSFGYFDTVEDHVTTVKNICNGLKKEGIFVLDYMNAHKVIQNLVMEETKQIAGIHFQISKTLQSHRIIKTIRIRENGIQHKFVEKVWALQLQDFEKMMQDICLEIKHLFGDYQLNGYDPEQSERLIIIAQKKV